MRVMLKSKWKQPLFSSVHSLSTPYSATLITHGIRSDLSVKPSRLANAGFVAFLPRPRGIFFLE